MDHIGNETAPFDQESKKFEEMAGRPLSPLCVTRRDGKHVGASGSPRSFFVSFFLIEVESRPSLGQINP